MKTRLQIQIEGEDYEALSAWARFRGTSLAGTVRWLIRDQLAKERQQGNPMVERFLAAAGSIHLTSNEGDVAAEHDRYLYGDLIQP